MTITAVSMVAAFSYLSSQVTIATDKLVGEETSLLPLAVSYTSREPREFFC